MWNQKRKPNRRRRRRRRRSCPDVCLSMLSVPRWGGDRQGRTQAKSKASSRDSPRSFAQQRWAKSSCQRRMAYPTYVQTGPCLAAFCQMLRVSRMRQPEPFADCKATRPFDLGNHSTDVSSRVGILGHLISGANAFATRTLQFAVGALGQLRTPWRCCAAATVASGTQRPALRSMRCSTAGCRWSGFPFPPFWSGCCTCRLAGSVIKL